MSTIELGPKHEHGLAALYIEDFCSNNHQKGICDGRHARRSKGQVYRGKSIQWGKSAPRRRSGPSLLYHGGRVVQVRQVDAPSITRAPVGDSGGHA
jgi:hypothetical protein